MVTFSSHPPGTPCWVDLMSPDVDASIAFYTSVFGWDAEDQHDDDGNRVYVLFTKDGRAVAGLGGQGPGMEGMPALWNTYVATDDPAATAEAVTAAGGSVLMPPMAAMQAGEMAIFTDATGATFSVWKAKDHPGVEVGNEPDTYSWSELLTRDLDTALAFYASVFGWEFQAQDMGPGGTYHLIAGGEEGLGGVMAMPAEMPDEVPAHWVVYFTSADLDATIAACSEAGGQVVFGPMDIPGVGRTASIHDPAGGSFAIMEPAG